MSAAPPSIALPGFADPVAGSQRTFRAVLEALSRPGRICRAGEDLSPPAPLDRATAAVLLTLIDGEAPLFLDPAFNPARDWLAFHCGANFVEQASATFALYPALPDLAGVSTGSHLAPEESATLILQLPALGTGRPFRLSGPGLRSPDLLAVDGLPDDFAERWHRNHAAFPCGVDLILCAGARLAALPRSIAVEAA